MVNIPLENHPCTYGPGWEQREKGKPVIGAHFNLPWLWHKLTFRRYCITLVDLDKHQELGTEAYIYFRWLGDTVQKIIAQQANLTPVEVYRELGYLEATSLLEVN